ncbi:MAG: endonuclease/exonuclease/phosphatase family protein [Bdellovibrionales bacterium]
MKILSYNIHKGFSTLNSKFVLSSIKKAIRTVGADMVFLQEVLGQHEKHSQNHKDWPTQFEFLADEMWPHYAYGKNAVYSEGHHGNAILSRYPIIKWENWDISTNQREKRGLLHSEIKLPKDQIIVHAICLHLDLLEKGRQLQADRLHAHIKKIPKEMPLILAGDFNDWRSRISEKLFRELGMKEAFEEWSGEHAKTFPSFFPLLRLDRIYYRHLKLKNVECLSGKPWNQLSDHVALMAEFESL